MKKVLAILLVIPGLLGCTEKLERRLAKAESRIIELEREQGQLEAGLLANDRTLSADIRNLKAATDRQIGDIRAKTDLFCVSPPSDPEDRGIRIYKEGRCN